MTAVCVTIASILGTYCAPNATIPPAAECVWYGDGAHCHVTEVTSIPLFLSYYDPLEGGINCSTDGDCEHLGDGTSIYDCPNCLACPPGMYWQRLEFAGEQWQCRDSGTAVVPTYREVYTAEGFVTGWFLVIDLLSVGRPHPLAYETIREWNALE